MSYSIDSITDNCYEGTSCLINKLGIRDDKQLTIVESHITLAKISILQKNPIDGNFDFEHYKSIHKFIFEDLYDWAGIPRTVDISEHIHEQEKLKNSVQDEISKKIIEERIKFTTNLVANKDIIENEFYILIWEKESENAEVEINKRANAWTTRLRNCEYDSEILNETDIILLAKSFTIPEFARKEGTDYRNNIVRIKRKE